MKSVNKFLFLLEKKQKYHIVLLILLTIIGSLLEAIGIGLVLPFLNIIDTGNVELPQSLKTFFPFLERNTNSLSIINILVFFTAFYLIKSLYMIFLISVQTQFYYSLQIKILSFPIF